MGIEIGPNMCSFLNKKFNDDKHFKVLNCPFEDIELMNSNYDLVYAASYFHWVDAKIGLPKIMNVLKNNGIVALFRYNPVIPNDEHVFEEIQKVYEKYYYLYYVDKSRPINKSKEMLLKPEEIKAKYGFKDLAGYGFKDVKTKFYDYTKLFNADEYIDYIDTMSDHRELPLDKKEKLYKGIKKVINSNGGRHQVDYIFQLYLGRKIISK